MTAAHARAKLLSADGGHGGGEPRSSSSAALLGGGGGDVRDRRSADVDIAGTAVALQAKKDSI